MSLFGTFRRTKGKKTSNDNPSGMFGLDMSSSSKKNPTVFNSTPNLYKIDQNVKINGKLKTITATPSKDYEKSGGITSKPSDGSGQSKWSFESRRTSSVSETWTGGGGSPSAPFRGPPVKKSSITSTSSMNRHFMSMMNVMGSLKRSKSIRKLAFGSAMNVSKDSSSSVGVTKDFSFTTKSKPKSRKSESDEFLPDVTDSGGQDGDGNSIASSGSHNNNNNNNNTNSSSGGIYRTNTEPGVISSGSSSASCSESGSLHDTNSIRASSEKSDIMEESDEECGENIVKNPEELKRQKTVLLGIKKFNMDHKKGIEFLVDKGILQHTSDDVSAFLKDGVGLSKASIGNYLGERIDFNEEVLKAFVDLHDFRRVNLVQALRQFLWSFRLPGESQKISRMLDAFADRYCQLNPDMFSVDTCSVLCYSIIMLNTEMHNPNVKDKVTVDQFIKRNRGIEGGEALDHNFMVSLYSSILTEPFLFPEEDGNDLMLTFFNPDIEGWLYKYGGRPKSWKRLWFILSNNCLYFFKFTTDKTPRGIIPLENILVRVPPDKPGKLHTMILYKESPDPRMVDQIKTCKTLSDGQTVPKLYTSIQLGTPSRKEREKWVKSINANHSMSKFYSELTLKKMKMSKSQSHLVTEKKVVRKSQISLPATVPGNDMGSVPIPEQVLNNRWKDPQNYFLHRNISSISLASSIQSGSSTLPKSKSRSESRLHVRKMKSKSPSMSAISQPEEFSKEMDLDRTLTAEDLHLDWSESTLKDAAEVLTNDLSPTRVNIDVKTETAVFENNLKKISLVEENSQSNRSSSENTSEESVPISITKKLSTIEISSGTSDAITVNPCLPAYSRPDLEDDPSSPKVELISYTRKSSIPAPDDFFPTAFESHVESIPKLVIDEAPEMLNIMRHKPDFESKLPEPSGSSNEDLSRQCQNIDLNLPLPEAGVSETDTCHSIEIIECDRSPDLPTKALSNTNRFGTIDFSQTMVLTKAPVNYGDSIYESNV